MHRAKRAWGYHRDVIAPSLTLQREVLASRHLLAAVDEGKGTEAARAGA